MAMMLAAGARQRDRRAAGGRRARACSEALFSGMDEHEPQKEQRDRARRPPDRVRSRGAAGKGLRADERGRDRRAPRARSRGWCCRSTRCGRAGWRRIRTASRIDMRRTLRASAEGRRRRDRPALLGPTTKPPPIVALLDISGSMSQYTRLFLHFLHALTDARKRVHTFLFGTRLTNVTRALKRARSRRGAGRLLGAACRTGPAARASPRRCMTSTS